MSTTYKTELTKRIQEAKRKYGNYLYHYTSINTLMGILEKKEFWLGNTANMNDTSELTDFTKRIIRVVLDRVNTNNPYWTEVIDSIQRGVKEHYPYAMCFSYGDEDAALWERYADSATGVCIAFNIEKLYQLFSGGYTTLDHVFYEYNEKQQEHVQIILDYIDGKKTGFSDLEGIISNLALCAACHKHKSFVSEKEVRLVSLTQPEKKERVFIKSDNSIKSMMKLDLSMLCNIREIDFQDVFGKIILGPRSKQRIVDLQEYIEFLGYPELAQRVKNSKCPLR